MTLKTSPYYWNPQFFGKICIPNYVYENNIKKKRLKYTFLGLGTSWGTTFIMLPPRLFQRIPFFIIPKLVNRIHFQPMSPLGTTLVNIPPRLLQTLNIKSNTVKGNYKDWVVLSKRGGKDRVFRGLTGLLQGISWGQSPEEIPRSSPASPRKTLSFPTLLLRFTFYFL